MHIYTLQRAPSELHSFFPSRVFVVKQMQLNYKRRKIIRKLKSETHEIVTARHRSSTVLFCFFFSILFRVKSPLTIHFTFFVVELEVWLQHNCCRFYDAFEFTMICSRKRTKFDDETLFSIFVLEFAEVKFQCTHRIRADVVNKESYFARFRIL